MNKINSLIPDYTIWLMYSSEQSDKYFCKYISNVVISSAVAIVSNKKTTVIVHELDSKNVTDDVKKIVYKDSIEFKNALEQTLKEYQFPAKIALNYSSNSQLDLIRTWYIYVFNRYIRKNIRNK